MTDDANLFQYASRSWILSRVSFNCIIANAQLILSPAPANRADPDELPLTRLRSSSDICLAVGLLPLTTSSACQQTLQDGIAVPIFPLMLALPGCTRSSLQIQDRRVVLSTMQPVQRCLSSSAVSHLFIRYDENSTRQHNILASGGTLVPMRCSNQHRPCHLVSPFTTVTCSSDSFSPSNPQSIETRSPFQIVLRIRPPVPRIHTTSHHTELAP